MTAKKYTGPPVTTPIDPASYPDPLMSVDEKPIGEDIVDKVNAGARLLFAMYHHPQAVELFSSPLMTNGLRKAYMAASKAWGI